MQLTWIQVPRCVNASNFVYLKTWDHSFSQTFPLIFNLLCCSWTWLGTLYQYFYWLLVRDLSLQQETDVITLRGTCAEYRLHRLANGARHTGLTSVSSHLGKTVDTASASFVYAEWGGGGGTFNSALFIEGCKPSRRARAPMCLWDNNHRCSHLGVPSKHSSQVRPAVSSCPLSHKSTFS